MLRLKIRQNAKSASATGVLTSAFTIQNSGTDDVSTAKTTLPVQNAPNAQKIISEMQLEIACLAIAPKMAQIRRNAMLLENAAANLE